MWYLPQKCGNAAMPQSGKNTELNIAFPGSFQVLHLISNVLSRNNIAKRMTGQN